MRRIPPPRTILRSTRHTSRGSRGKTALRGLRIPHPEKAGKGTDLALLQPNPPEIDHLAISVSKFPSLLCLLSTLLPPPPSPHPACQPRPRKAVHPACRFSEWPPEGAPPHGWHRLALSSSPPPQNSPTSLPSLSLYSLSPFRLCCCFNFRSICEF